MTAFVPFIDITGDHATRVPYVRGGLRAYYATGTGGVEETAAQVAAARAAGMGVILIDQTPSLSVFAAGLADVADVEHAAGTPASAANAVAARQSRGWQSTLYVSWSGLPALKEAVRSPRGVWYGVADYSWSIQEAQALLEQHPDWAYVQYGDNITNAGTLVPGTSITCGQAACDIDVARGSWAAEFLRRVPEGPYRHVLGAGQTWRAFAASRGADPASLFRRSVNAWTAEDWQTVLGLPAEHWVAYTLNP